jgi:hypothetical protein
VRHGTPEKNRHSASQRTAKKQGADRSTDGPWPFGDRHNSENGQEDVSEKDGSRRRAARKTERQREDRQNDEDADSQYRLVVVAEPSNGKVLQPRGSSIDE